MPIRLRRVCAAHYKSAVSTVRQDHTLYRACGCKGTVAEYFSHECMENTTSIVNGPVSRGSRREGESRQRRNYDMERNIFPRLCRGTLQEWADDREKFDKRAFKKICSDNDWAIYCKKLTRHCRHALIRSPYVLNRQSDLLSRRLV